MENSAGSLAAGVNRLEESKDLRLKTLGSNSSLLLSINNSHYFDLDAWYHSDARTNNRYPEMDKNLFKLFAADIENHGILEKPVLDSRTFEVVEGRTRLTALYLARSAGKECNFPGFRLMRFENETAVQDYQDRSSLQKRQLTRAHRQDLIRQAIMRHPDYADNHIGAIVQADAGTVKRLSDELISQGKITRPTERLGLDGRWTSVQVKDKPRKKAKESCVDERLLIRWRDMFGFYPIVDADAVEIMRVEKYSLGDGSIVKGCNKSTLINATKWLDKAAISGLTVNGLFVYKRFVREGHAVYGLIRNKDRRPDIEVENANQRDLEPKVASVRSANNIAEANPGQK